MREAVFAAVSWDGPPTAIEIKLRPSRPVNFAAALGGQESDSEKHRDQRTLVIERFPHEPNFVFAEDTVALLFFTGRLDHVARVRFQPFALDRKVEHLSHERQRPVCHDRCVGGNLVKQVTDVAALDVFDPPITPSLDQRHMRPLAGLLLMWGTVQKPDVLAPTAFLAGVTIDVLAGKIREGLGRRSSIFR